MAPNHPRKRGEVASLIVTLYADRKEKPFSCNYCDRSFTRKDSVKTHIKRHHTHHKDIASDETSRALAQESEPIIRDGTLLGVISTGSAFAALVV